ncbi:unnamed protein product [Gordionus sp. m RMFG-2023]|uniref:trafficking protein particle complex subunit 5-like n=1 Tax=Gordionus sp. m RMFG-2023 TaxID=3053472 RepID=UPI0030DE2F94
MAYKYSSKITILDKPITKLRSDMAISTFYLLFSEMVQYSQNRSNSVIELQQKLADMGYRVGQRYLELMYIREKNYKRDIKLVPLLIYIKNNLWKQLFDKEAEKLEHANDNENTYYIIEKESFVNKYISVPKDKGNLNCAYFIAGIIQAFLYGCNFPSKITVHWHKGVTFMIVFDENIISREKMMEK